MRQRLPSTTTERSCAGVVGLGHKMPTWGPSMTKPNIDERYRMFCAVAEVLLDEVCPERVSRRTKSDRHTF